MKKIYLLLLGIFLIFSINKTNAQASKCNWNAVGPVYKFWDSCKGQTGKFSVNGFLYFKSKGCFVYEWTVNGQKAGNNNVMSYIITKNGKYDVCVTVKDTCNNCDTTFCNSRNITCISNCNWKAQNPGYYFWDSCAGTKNKYSLNGYISYKSSSCLRYEWYVNGKYFNNSNILNYPITQNGKYNVCVKVIDTCNNCDTMYCSARTISCISTNPCIWKPKSPQFSLWDSCNAKKVPYSINGFIYFPNKTCLTYEWTVNGKNMGSNYYMSYPISANGNYTVCVKVKDTCNKCDTTFCSTRSFSCIKSGGCNFKRQAPYFSFWDSCTGKVNKYSINGYISFSNKSCLSYKWTVNGNPISASGYFVSYPITANGTYNLCVKVIDSCNNCDTTFCSTRVISCIGSKGCNWRQQKPAYYFWDTCSNSTKHYSLNGYLVFSSNSCIKYQWTVNGKPAGNNYVFNYPVSSNGTYNVCVKVSDTCNKCDTTYCSSRVISCFGSTKCNFKSQTMYYSVWDTCKTKTNNATIFGYLGNTNKCFKFQWFFNGKQVSTLRSFSYTVTQNGTYYVCLLVTDSCNKCDTTYCSTRTISCLKSNPCNWNKRIINFYYLDSCTSRTKQVSVVGFIPLLDTNCAKYSWTVNGKAAGNQYWMRYPVTADGNYKVCVRISDSCNACSDTSLCGYVNVKCFAGVKQNATINKLDFYPNPANDALIVDWKNADAIYSLVDVSGRIVQQGILKTGTQQLLLNALPQGIFVIQVVTDQNIFRSTVVIKH